MAIVKMKRLHLIGLTEEREALLANLLRQGCVEVTEPEDFRDPAWAGLLERDEAVSLPQLREQRNAVSESLETLKKYVPKQFHMMEKREAVSERELFCDARREKALAVAGTLNQRARKIAQLLSREGKLEQVRLSLEPWKGLELPLEMTETATAKILLGTCPAAVQEAKLLTELEAAAPMAKLLFLNKDKEHRYLVLICRKEEAEQAEDALRRHMFSLFRPKDMAGTPAENLVRLAEEKTQCVQQREDLAAQIVSQGEHCRELKHCLDRLNQDFAKLAAQNRLMTDGTILYLTGWVPEPSIPALQKSLEPFCCAEEYVDPGPEDTVPTLLRNPKWMECINMVTEMYSLPEYRRGIDPNPLIFFIYIIFFGFMFADIGYGIIIFTLSLLVTKKFRPQKTLGYMFRLGQYLGISTTIFGVLTGGFFGDFLYELTSTFLPEHVIVLPALINPLSSPMQILTIAIVMGCIHMFFGQCIHMYMEARDGHPWDGIWDVVPWWVVFAGIGLFAWKGTALGIAAGFLVLLLTQGRHKKGFFGKLFGGIASWYDITSWLGDVLSYSRLMALMLATTVIAQVMNILGTLPHNIVVFFLIFLIGHTFNIGINLIGTYVHAARLQYLEFFSKFYKEGGIPFRPLQYDTKYVDVTEESGEVI